MSELINTHTNRAAIRWKLLTSASALALAAYTSSAGLAAAQDADRPTVWIELGGQLSRLADSSEPFAPDFASMRPSNFSPSSKFEKSPLFGFDEVGKISWQPNDSGWVFSAALRYGRASANRHVRQQSAFADPQRYYLYPSFPSIYQATRAAHAARFADTTARNSEQHTIADFQAGKDVGLGLFGGRGSSVVSAGIRFAQFTDKTNTSLKSDPDWRFVVKSLHYAGYTINGLGQPYHSNAAGFVADRSFRGIGPSLSWNASAPVVGNTQDVELDLDWGVNAAVLFGRQKSRTQHHETVRYNNGGYGTVLDNFFGYTAALLTVYQHASPPRTRSRGVIVPNIGGLIGISVKKANAKISFGYRGDFFFGTMDGGIDSAHRENVGFYGPFASISVGLGG